MNFSRTSLSVFPLKRVSPCVTEFLPSLTRCGRVSTVGRSTRMTSSSRLDGDGRPRHSIHSPDPLENTPRTCFISNDNRPSTKIKKERERERERERMRGRGSKEITLKLTHTHRKKASEKIKLLRNDYDQLVNKSEHGQAANKWPQTCQRVRRLRRCYKTYNTQKKKVLQPERTSAFLLTALPI